MFQASLCPSSEEQDCMLPHMVFCTGCAGRGRVELTRSLRPSSTRPRPAQLVQNTICGNTQSCSPEDGYNDTRNVLR